MRSVVRTAYDGRMTRLLDLVRRHADAHADDAGIALMPIRGLFAVRATTPSGLTHDISRPLVCLVLQGAKRVTVGAQPYDFAAGDSLLVTADVPAVSQITRASISVPYYSLVLELDAAVISDIAGQMKDVWEVSHDPVRVYQTDAEVTDAALRLVRLLDRPESIPVLQAQLVGDRQFRHAFADLDVSFLRGRRTSELLLNRSVAVGLLEPTRWRRRCPLGANVS